MTPTTTFCPATHLIPNIPGADTTVTYVLDDPETVKTIAEHYNAPLREYHYEQEPDVAEHWILHVWWRSGDLRLTAQSAITFTPTLTT